MPPQHIIIVVRKFRGPNFRIVAVANGWQSTYGMKNMSITKDFARPVRQDKSCSIGVVNLHSDTLQSSSNPRSF